MKKRLPAFVSGMLTMALIVGLGVSALAATGQLTLTVDPVNIQVNGSTFAPKDATGADVPVFAYNGTTYAPLRALAEAYGLTVGYDGAARMATVSATPAAPETTPADYSDWSAEDEAAYQEFKGLWEVGLPRIGNSISYTAKYSGSLDRDSFAALWRTGGMDREKLRDRMCLELIDQQKSVRLSFYFGEVQLAEVLVEPSGEVLISMDTGFAWDYSSPTASAATQAQP